MKPKIPRLELGKTNELNEQQMATIMKAIGLSAPFGGQIADTASSIPSFPPRSTPLAPADDVNPPASTVPDTAVKATRGIICNLSSEEKKPPDIPAQPKSKLLSIPGELRNRIYRFAIIEPDSIIIDRMSWASHQPALLKTCRQIRAEALPLFYVENKISANIHHWNPIAKERCHRLMASYNIKPQHIYYYFSGLPNWTNLLAWLQDVYEERMVGISTCVGEQKPLHRKTIGVMFLMVSKARGNIPWMQLVELLEAQKELLGANDPQWLV